MIQVTVSNLEGSCFGFTAVEVVSCVLCLVYKKVNISEMASLSEAILK